MVTVAVGFRADSQVAPARMLAAVAKMMLAAVVKVILEY